MNFQQLEYLIAVDNHRHFFKASKECFVSQATLSIMIQKLEAELNVKIFDRSKQPVVPTDIGSKIIAQARRTISEAARIKEIIQEEKGEISGELRIGIIPTIAPYLLPLFLKKFTTAYPLIKLIISEHTTDSIVQRLKLGQLDTAIIATPLNDSSISEQVMFYEKYFLYVGGQERGFTKQYVLPAEIDINRLWLLEEGHCMRSQILNLCKLKKQHEIEEKLHYEAGSIETLKNLVEKNFGMTIIPELATVSLSKAQKKRLRFFKPPSPVREISIVTHREYLKVSLIDALKDLILSVISNEMKSRRELNILDI